MDESQCHAGELVANVEKLVDEDNANGRGEVEDDAQSHLASGRSYRHDAETSSVVLEITSQLLIMRVTLCDL